MPILSRRTAPLVAAVAVAAVLAAAGLAVARWRGTDEPAAVGGQPNAPAAAAGMIGGLSFAFPPGPAPSGLVAGLARALGLTGAPVRSAAGWTLVDGPRTLTVADSAGWPWRLGPLGPPGPLPAGSGTGQASPVPVAPPAAPQSPAPSMTAVPEPGQPVDPLAHPRGAAPVDRAQAVLRAVLAAAPGTAAADVSTQLLPTATRAVAAHRWDGRPVARWTTSVDVAAPGVAVGGTGLLATPEPAERDPTISAAQAARQLAAQPRPLGIPCPAPSGTAPPPAARNCSLGPPSVTGSAPGFVLVELPGRGLRLAPAWLLSVRGQAAPVPVIALPDRSLRGGR